MKINWKIFSYILIFLTIFLTIVLLFFNSNQNKKNTILEEHLKSKNLSFKKEIDSLFLTIEINNKKLNKITDTIYLYQKKKR
jgi:major membrane immunogen (membrane-anchored lipoprotein)